MTTYEFMVLVETSVDMTTEKAQKDLIKKLIGDAGTVKEITSLGKKTLAYAIKKQTEATYLVAVVEGTLKTGDIEKRTKLMEEVLRFLLTVKE